MDIRMDMEFVDVNNIMDSENNNKEFKVVEDYDIEMTIPTGDNAEIKVITDDCEKSQQMDDGIVEDESEEEFIAILPAFQVDHEYPNFENYPRPEYSSEIQLNCVIHNMNALQIDQPIQSPVFHIRNCPFSIQVQSAVKKIAKNIKNNDSNQPNIGIVFQVIFDDTYHDPDWTCRFTTTFWAMGDENTGNKFNHTMSKTIKRNQTVMSHELDQMFFDGLDSFSFKLTISGELPSNWSSVEATGYIGLRNEGATCYVNTLFQSLFATNEFRRIVFNAPVDDDDIKHSFVFDLQKIFYLMQFHRMPEIGTKEFISHFGWDQMTTHHQQDIQEFSRLLIDKLNDYLHKSPLENAIRDLYVGRIRTTTECMGNISSTEEEFLDLQLSIESNGSIEEAFQSLVAPQDIKDFSYCFSKHDATQKQEFITLPSILSVHLMRFRFNSKTFQANKNNRRFQFGANLDLSQHLAGSEYVLHSVLVHSGSVNSGHYTAFVNPRCDGDWYKFDDRTVTKCTSKEAIENNFGNRGDTSAYMLIYINKLALPNMLRPVPIESIPMASLMEVEIERIRSEAEWYDKRHEIQVFYPERLVGIELKRGESIFDVKDGKGSITIYIEHNKILKDLYDQFYDIFCVDGFKNKIELWILDAKGAIRFSDTKDKIHYDLSDLDTPIDRMFKMYKKQCFIQSQPNPPKPFDKAFEVLVFLKEYIPTTDVIKFFDCERFTNDCAIADVVAHIRAILHLSEDVRIQIYTDGGKGAQYKVEVIDDQAEMFDIIYKKDSVQPVQTFTFEVIEDGQGAIFEKIKKRMTNEKNEDAIVHDKIEPEICGKQPPKNSNELTVKFKNMRDPKLDFMKDVAKSETLESLVAIITHIVRQDVVLFDSNNDEIDCNFQSVTIEDFMLSVVNNEDGRRNTRSRTSQVTFYFKTIAEFERDEEPETRPDAPDDSNQPWKKVETKSKSNSKSKSKKKGNCKDAGIIVELIDRKKSSNSKDFRLRLSKVCCLKDVVIQLADELVRETKELKFFNANNEEIDDNIFSLSIDSYITTFHPNSDKITLFYEVFPAWKQNQKKHFLSDESE